MDANLRNSVSEIHRHIIECAHSIISTMIQNHYLDVSTASELQLFASQLLKLLPDASKPFWLIELLDFEGRKLSSSFSDNDASEFAKLLLSNMHHIELPILTPDEVNYDFDIAFNDVREAQDIPATFDGLVTQLEQIIAADLIDSRVVQQGLERLMALLKRNKHGSLASILVSMHYGRFAIKAFGGALAANKYLKPMVEAFKDEFADAERKVQAAEKTLKQEATQRLTNHERLLAFLEQSGTDKSAVTGFLGHDDLDVDEAE